jgi:hypothetical protein
MLKISDDVDSFSVFFTCFYNESFTLYACHLFNARNGKLCVMRINCRDLASLDTTMPLFNGLVRVDNLWILTLSSRDNRLNLFEQSRVVFLYD